MQQNPFSYVPQQFNYGSGYNRLQAFLFPIGISQMIVQKMQKASDAFRQFDKDNTGSLDKGGIYNYIIKLIKKKENILKKIKRKI